MSDIEVTDREREEAALNFRRLPRMLNCAQGVAAACGREELTDGLAGFGGGRAPEGLCGALYAALVIASPDKREEVLKAFAEKVGAQKCSDIKNGTKTPCLECVAAGIALARGMK